MAHDFHTATSTEADRLCDVAAQLNLPQLPLFQAAANGLINLFHVPAPSVAWPARMVKRAAIRPICFLIGADPGYGHPNHEPETWACARRLRYWVQTGGAIIHGSGGEVDHYREAVEATLKLRRLVFIECSSAMVPLWRAFLDCPRTLLILPSDGPHPVPNKGVVH